MAAYVPALRAELVARRLPPLAAAPLHGARPKASSVEDTIGDLSHLGDKANGKRTLVLATSLLETYLCELATLVYLLHPAKLAGSTDEEPRDRRDKLLTIVMDSASREEILDRIIEERVRSIFYGNPTDFFKKDKAKLEFGDYFAIRASAGVAAFAEITARRNVVVHNGGRIDRKYLREVRGTAFAIGDLAALGATYLQGALRVLSGLGAAATKLVMLKVLKGRLNNLLSQRVKFFEREVLNLPS